MKGNQYPPNVCGPFQLFSRCCAYFVRVYCRTVFLFTVLLEIQFVEQAIVFWWVKFTPSTTRQRSAQHLV